MLQCFSFCPGGSILPLKLFGVCMVLVPLSASSCIFLRTVPPALNYSEWVLQRVESQVVVALFFSYDGYLPSYSAQGSRRVGVAPDGCCSLFVIFVFFFCRLIGVVLIRRSICSIWVNSTHFIPGTVLCNCLIFLLRGLCWEVLFFPSLIRSCPVSLFAGCIS
jgi:hypothetical protein